mgnify:CR=1 FL=1
MSRLNYKILAIVLKHYFCNIGNYAWDEDTTISYYNTFIDKINGDCDIGWDELEDYLIWQPFENTSPTYVADNMQSLYYDIVLLLD